MLYIYRRKQQCIMSRKSFKMFTEDPLLSRVTKNTKKSFYLNVQNLLYLLAGNGFKYSAHTDVLRIV